MWLFLKVAGSRDGAEYVLFNMSLVRSIEVGVTSPAKSCLVYENGEEVFVDHPISQITAWLQAGGAHLGSTIPNPSKAKRSREVFEEDN